MERCVELALENNPKLRAAHWEVATTRAQSTAAASARLPHLRALGSYAHTLDEARLVPTHRNGEPGVFGDDLWAADLVLTLPLFTGGRLVNEVRASELLLDAARQRLGRTRDELVFNVSSLFYTILGQERVVESLQFSLQALEHHRSRVEQLLRAQKAARVDLLRTEVRLADLQQRLVREQNVVAIQRRGLLNLLGLEKAPEAWALRGDLTLAAEAPDLTEAVAAAENQRPDYQAARAALEAEARRVDVARGARWPSLSLRGSYGWRWAAGATQHPSGTQTAEDVGSLAFLVDVPLFEGGRLDAREREARARLAAARERLRQLELQILLDVETAVRNIASSRRRVEATRAAVTQAEESFRIEREKYTYGKGTITDVLDAQSALLDAQTQLYRALADHRIARAQLHLAVGES
ncbi:MAG: TolC family protein [Deferrisomatales bacterium]